MQHVRNREKRTKKETDSKALKLAKNIKEGNREEKDHLSKEMRKIKNGRCVICGNPYEDYGFSPYPVVTDTPNSRCCMECHRDVVTPARSISA